MYQNEQFQQVGTLSKGELVVRLPGTNVKMPYETGTAFVNEAGNVGYVALNVNDVVAESAGEVEGLIGMLGEELTEQLQDPAIKEQIKQIVAKTPVSIFYSRTQDGLEVLTMPGMGGENGVDDSTMPGFVVATYNTSGEIPTVEEVYAFHSSAVAGRELLRDKAVLQREVPQVAVKANDVYERALQLMKEMGF